MSVEATHYVMAENYLELARREFADGHIPLADHLLAAAQVHATLAIIDSKWQTS